MAGHLARRVDGAAGVTDLRSFIAGVAAVPAAVVIDRASSALALEWAIDPDDESHESEGADPAVGSGTEVADLDLPYLLGNGTQVRRALVLVAVVALFVMLALQYGWSWHLLVVAAYGAVLIGCAATDLLVHRIPNVFVYPAIAAALVIGAVAPGAELRDVLLGGGLVGGVYLVMALLVQGGVGDAKLGAFVGLALGLRLGAQALIIGGIAGGAGALLILVIRRFQGLRAPMAYGPYIALGGLVVMLFAGTAFTSL